MDSITLRPTRTEDQPFLFEVYASTRKEELAPVPWSDEQKAAFLRMQFDAQHKYYHEQFADAEFLVILRNEQPVGRLYVHRQPSEINIVDIALLSEHRRAGIGGKLLRDLLNEADRVGLPVRIHVERFNPALHLYERLGFRKTGDTGVYFLMERLPVSTTADAVPAEESSPPAAWQRFRTIVEQDEELQKELRDIQDRNLFISRVVQLGESRGCRFTATEVEEAMKVSHREWLERSLM